ncbi:putative P-loop containing nucleoside triphosphate hydrolase, DNA2/NAM7 helicase, helicase [Helianthus annuus]|nr:putative P-loop containing nucleoside triphosphate hydrolase, DNA2/NAM7 helicase, helicase [Helianthus annuus]KAJ0891038.1 putative P-loop containing nucleoside triphosphate hydrolase, DNA2/NAM7 helicase, helicase [Helianthus annuus]
MSTRTELLTRWRLIEEEDDDDDECEFDNSKQLRLRRLKESWFSDAFNFLIYLPRETHIWCGSWDIMGPLLETFYNYFKDDRPDSPLKLLWKRVSEELQDCMQCICQHHQAKDTYAMEYELSSIGPLLHVLCSLDEERVTNQLKQINTQIAQGKYNPVKDSAKVISVMYEVLMFPVLLDDQSLATEFQIFMERVEDSHELTLAGHQQYPGVYALLFLKTRRCRSIGFRLAGNMGKLRSAEDLDPLQPLLKKCIVFLETEVVPTSSESSRPRMQLDRATVWLGIKALLGFLEPHAFEEGILERYPSFLSIVLNHISGDSLEFSYAINCLRLLFDMLGCKLWLRATLSPSVMRDTLLGQCFHTQDEKSHKEIFDLFPPFLQSLEALQDGEHKNQRRHFLYFLLHQVTVSSNFSALMRKKACQIALLIIHRGYKMNPSCPPFECAHMWGPSLVASLKDSSLYSSLRQPAFDLIETILVSDASALVSSILHYQIHKGVDRNKVEFKDEDGNEGLFEDDVEEKDTSTSCWSEFSVQGQTAASEFGVWMCIPMLWVDVLVEIDPAVLPVSFSKAVSWALSRFSMVEPESNTETALPVGHWLTTRAPEVSRLLGWRTPSGFDDGGDGEESKNSVKVITMCIPLIRTFRRLTSHFITRMEQGKQWTWEPRMAESLILLLVDPDDNARQVGRRILEQVANTRGLLSCLQFLCSCSASISSLYLGLKHARELLLLNPVLLTFQSVHHFFFVLCKLLKEGVPAGQSNDHSSLKLSSQGGFLQQPTFESIDGNSSKFDFTHWEKFSCLVSEVAWTSFCICLSEGKTFIDYKISQMTCIRLLECLPVVLQRLLKSMHKLPGDSDILVKNSVSYKWLHDLIYWGRSTLTVVHRYWKQAVLSLLDLLKESCVDKTSTIMAIEKLFNCENIPIDEFTEQVLGLFVSLVNDDTVPCRAYEKLSLKDPLSQAEGILREKCMLRDLPLKESDFGAKTERENVIVLTDDENDVRDDINTLQSAERASQMNEGSKSSSFDTIGLVDIESNVDKSCVIKGKLLQDTSKEKSSAAQRTKSCVENLSSKSLKNISRSSSSQSIKKDSAKSDRVIKELVFDAKDDPWEFALKSARHNNQSHLGKPNTGGPKRKVIQLNLPVENRVSQSNRLRGGHQRFKPVRLDDWYRPILEMDYYATVGLASSSSAVAIGNLKEVPVYFESPDDYVAVFRPLVLEELKAQLHNSFLEMSSTDEMSCGSLSVMSVERVDDFHLVRCVHDDRDLEGSKTCVENDLVLLTRQPFQTSSHEVHMVGKIERCEKDNKRRSSILMIKLYLQNGCSRLNRAKKLLMERSKWYIYRIMSITSQLREFQALSSLHSIPLLPIILNPNNQPKLIKSRMDLSNLSQLLQQILKSSFNDSQLQAINTVTDKRNDLHLSLIQGPPGTGKTRTIVAIVSALLSLTGMNARRTESCDMRPTMNKLSQSAAFARAWQDAALAKQLKDGEGKNYTATASHIRGRVVICAQSNAAVDELVSRISSHGLYGSDGSMYKPYLVRVGNAKTVHSSSLPFFIDTLVDERLTEEENRMDVKSDMDGGDSSSVVRSKLEKLVDRIRFLEAKRANLSNGNPDTKHCLEGDAGMGGDDVKEMSDAEIGARLRVLYSDKKAVYIELAAAQAREKKVNEKRKALKLKLRKSILKEAEIVITTLSGCGGDLYAVCSESMLTHKFSPSSESSLFDAVVIDEAAQALEPATLIPLQLLKSKGGKCIMVGDPKQLPATVLSDVASKYLYQCSMFERLQKAGHPVTMLTQQYRMHPEICHFPSLHFYDGNLLNGDGMSSKEKPFHKTKGLGPYLFFDIADGVELHGKNSGSLYNECEADAAVELIRFFRKCYPSEFVGGKIGVITPYRSQLSLLRSRFSAAFGSCILDEMELNTVDGFQGREVDILVVSTVRASSSGTSETNSNRGIGFVADVRRMNVALTRAKHSLWVLGNVRTLQRNKNWGALVNDAKDRNLVLSVEKPYASMFNCSLIIKSDRRVSDKKKGNVVNRHTEQARSSKSKRGWYHSNDNSKEGKKAKVQYHDSSSSANKGNESENSVKKTATDKDFRGKKEKQRVDRNTAVGGSSISVERTIDPNHKKRKQQREAVDALLPSGFISSSNKKPESSSLKSVPNSNRSGHAIKQTTSRRKGS